MTNILTCIDGSAISTAVCDAGAWASQRLSAPLELLHVLDKTEFATQGDLSGNIGLGSREHLLEELVELDERRGKLALENGKHMLEAATQRALEDGAVDISSLQRHGNLVDTLLELESRTRLLVVGRLGEGHACESHTIGSHLESVIRTVHRPILIAVPQFKIPQRFMLAYDGSTTAHKALNMVVASPLLQGLDCHLVMVSNVSDERVKKLNSAYEILAEGGFKVTRKVLDGDVHTELLRYHQAQSIDLMVMGAYGHSRIRQFFVGSNTTKMVSLSDIPLLLLR